MAFLWRTKIIFMYSIYPSYEIDSFASFKFFILCSGCFASFSTPRRSLRGETYVIEVPKGWNRPSAVRSCDEPLRRRREGYETTKFMRVYSKRKDRCGSVLTIIEVQNCKCYQEIFEKDSVSALADATRVKVIYRSINGRKR